MILISWNVILHLYEFGGAVIVTAWVCVNMSTRIQVTCLFFVVFFLFCVIPVKLYFYVLNRNLNWGGATVHTLHMESCLILCSSHSVNRHHLQISVSNYSTIKLTVWSTMVKKVRSLKMAHFTDESYSSSYLHLLA